MFYTNILPVVVLYKQNLEQSLTLQSMQVSLDAAGIERMQVFVYDNSPEASAGTIGAFGSFDIIYHHDPLNGGLSKAYNVGAAKARVLNKEWLLLLDQDTTFPSNTFPQYAQAAEKHPEIGLIAPILKLSNNKIFSPCLAKHKRGYPVGQLSPGLHNLYKLSPVNSGLLVKLSLFERAGGYNEKVKVDFCDFQFLEKVRRIDPRFYLMPMSALQDFSNEELSLSKQQHRFNIYLEDAVNCDKPEFSDKLGFFYTVTRHALGLSLKMRHFSFINMYLCKFLIRKDS